MNAHQSFHDGTAGRTIAHGPNDARSRVCKQAAFGPGPARQASISLVCVAYKHPCVCPHTNTDNCDCRKPKPGMLREIAARFNADLTGVPAVGDSLRDLQAAAAVGAQPMLVLTGKGRKTVDDPALPADTLVFPDLAAAAAHIAR